MEIVSTPEADRFIRGRGSSLYVWLKPIGPGSDWTRLAAVTERPQDDVQFDCRDARGFEFCLQIGLAVPARVSIRLRRWPWRRIVVRGFRARGSGGSGGAGGDDGGREETDGVVWWERAVVTVVEETSAGVETAAESQEGWRSVKPR